MSGSSLIGKRVTWAYINNDVQSPNYGRPNIDIAGEVVAVDHTGLNFMLLILKDDGSLASALFTDVKVASVVSGDQIATAVKMEAVMTDAYLNSVLAEIGLSQVTTDEGVDDCGVNRAAKCLKGLAKELAVEAKAAGALEVERDILDGRVAILIKERDEALARAKAAEAAPKAPKAPKGGHRGGGFGDMNGQ